MTVGDEYERGFTAGYQARCREEAADYLRVVEAGRQVYDRTVRSLVNLPTIAELRAARVAVLVEGHAAGMHTGDVRSPDCPGCNPDRPHPTCIETTGPADMVAGRRSYICGELCPQTVESVRYGVDRRGCPNEVSAECCSELGYCAMLSRNRESDRHHSGHYGAPFSVVERLQAEGRAAAPGGGE